jgi:hypothetical protein
MTRKNKYAPLLRDPDVSRWHRNVARGSPLTAEVALKRLSRVCELLSMSPRDMVDRAQSNLKDFQDVLEDMVARLEDEKKSPGYIQGILKTVKSWLRYNDITLTRRIKISNSTATPTIENEQIPSQEDLARILRASSPRIRSAIAFLAFANLRPQTLGNNDGSDGLMLKDLPELKIEDKHVVFETMPTIVVVRPLLSKARHKYFTFLSAEGCTYLKEYLEERIRSGEELKPETPLIAHERKEAATKLFMLTSKTTHFIRLSMRKAGVYKRPYVLRAYAETQLIIAESKGKISHPYLQFIAGHKGDIESRYSTNKGFLPPDMIEDMRKCYRECEPFLSTAAQPLEQSVIIKEAKIEALKSIAKSLLGIDLLEVRIAKEKELEKELDTDETIELFEDELKKLREGKHNPQRIIREEELERHLVEGWHFVSTLPSQRILIKKGEIE